MIEVLHYSKEVVILGPGHFISHWTWTIAFDVLLFLGLVGESGGWVETAPGAGDTRRGSQPSPRRGPACCTRCEYECAEQLRMPCTEAASKSTQSDAG